MGEDGGIHWEIKIDVDETERALGRIEVQSQQAEQAGKQVIEVTSKAMGALREVEAEASRIEDFGQTVQSNIRITVTDLQAVLDAIINKKESVEQAIATVFAQIPTLDQALVHVEEKREATERAVGGTVKGSFAILNAVARSFQNMVGLFSQFLSPLQQALFSALFTVIDVMIAIASAQYSNPYTFAVGIAMTIASTTLSIIGAAAVEQGFGQIEGHIQTANQVIGQVFSVFSPTLGVF